MDYNYYPQQAGHPPPPHPPPASNPLHHGAPQMQQQQQQQPPPGCHMIHSSMPLQAIRQTMQSGPQTHPQQQQQQQQHPPQQHQLQQLQQQQQHLSQHLPQQLSPQQQQQHPNYHPIQPQHPHGPAGPHSGSPHPQQTQQQQQPQNHNHQPALAGPIAQQPAIPTHHLHPQSPHHLQHNGPHQMHVQQQQPHPPPQLNHQMVANQTGPTVIMNHLQPGIQGQQQPPPPQHHHHPQNFFNGGPIPQSNMHHFSQQNQHHAHHQPLPPPPPPPAQHHHHPHHQHPMMHPHGGPPPMSNLHHHPHLTQQPIIGRSSPYYPSILQTEFRIIELNRRLQCRPIPRHPVSPLPHSSYDESLWWEKFASEFFEDDATLTLRILDDKPIEYSIGRRLIPRFFRACFENGAITDLSINLRNPKEACIHPHLITLDCDQAFIITNKIFKHPALATNQSVVVHTEGHLILDFVSNSFDTLSIKSWKFYTTSCREYIDRSVAAMGVPNNFLVDYVAKQGFTKSTVFYLKMCKLIEPMQDLMILHKQTKLDPRSCLKKLLFDRYKFKGIDDNRAATNKRRKRKPSAAPPICGTGTNKKSKANVNNNISNNNNINNNIMMSPSGPPAFSLASQDVMTVGEPTMMGGDFGDDNERMITRLENTQYDPIASTPSNTEEADLINTSTGNEQAVLINNNNNSNNNLDSSMESNSMSPSLLQQQQLQHQQQQQPPPPPPPQQATVPLQQQQQQPRQQQPAPQHQQTTPLSSSLPTPPPPPPPPLQQHQSQHQQPIHQILPTQVPAPSVQPGSQHQQVISQENQIEQTSPPNAGQKPAPVQQPHPPQSQVQQSLATVQQQNLSRNIHESSQLEEPVPSQGNQISLNESGDPQPPSDEMNRMHQQRINDQILKEIVTRDEASPDGKLNQMAETTNDPNIMIGVNSVEMLDNHSNSIQPLNEESNSNSQLPCSTASATTPMEQQQPVDNGVA